MQLDVDRNPGLATLALPDAQRGQVSIQRQIPRLDRQRLGDPESGLPLDQERQSRPGIRSGPDQHEASDAGPWDGDSARRMWSAGLLKLGSRGGIETRPFPREVVQFRGRAQLRRGCSDATLVPISFHGLRIDFRRIAGLKQVQQSLVCCTVSASTAPAKPIPSSNRPVHCNTTDYSESSSSRYSSVSGFHSINSP